MKFKIEDITITAGNHDVAYGTVAVEFEEDFRPDVSVSHFVSVKSRVRVSGQSTVDELRAALVHSAKTLLPQAISYLESRTLPELIAEDRSNREKEDEPFQFDGE